jgi:hypothetical protein
MGSTAEKSFQSASAKCQGGRLFLGKFFDGEDVRRYLHGVLHRDGDLPAVIRANGAKEWWANGIRVK